jgi:uncharacterized protein YjbI with pentapeptide repeats
LVPCAEIASGSILLKKSHFPEPATAGELPPAEPAPSAVPALAAKVSEPAPAEHEAPAVPPLAAKADDLEAIRMAVIDAAGVSFGLWVSYLFVLFYLLVAAGGVTHRDLFFESPVKLPFLNVDLPLKGFFWLGPALFLIIHVYVLLHFVMLSAKVRVFDVQLRAQIDDREVRARLRRQLPSNIFVQFLAGPRELRDGIMGFLLWLIAFISLVIGPVALLVFFQLQFLPYHDEWITWWQRIAVVIDVALLWTLWPRVGLPERISAEKSKERRRGFVAMTQLIGTIVGMLLITLVSVPIMFAIATFPGEWVEEGLKPFQPIQLLRNALVAGEIDTDARRPKSLWSNRLVLPGLDVIDHTKLDTESKIAALPETASLRTRHLEGVVLIGAGLRKVDFTGAHLEDAGLSKTDLRDAKLDGAHLEGASVDDFAQLQGASFREAHLERASLNYAHLERASLYHAHLEGASLFRAYLEGASLEGAHLEGALLRAAHLEGASLPAAHLEGASLGGAHLKGALLNFAQLQAASLDHDSIWGAVQLQGASLYGAHLEGASLRGAQLQAASLDVAQLQAASLRKAFVWRADARTANMTDARIDSVETEPKQFGESGYGMLYAEPFNKLKQPIGSEFFNRLKQRMVRDVPEGRRRDMALARVETRLDPDTPLVEETQIAERWIAFQRPLSPDAYEAKMAEHWRQIGCSPDGAPYVIAGLIRIMRPGEGSPFFSDSVQVPWLAGEFLKNRCDGASGLSDDAKEVLKALRDSGIQNPNQSVQRRGRMK